jgi:hypothetical protein
LHAIRILAAGALALLAAGFGGGTAQPADLTGSLVFTRADGSVVRVIRPPSALVLAAPLPGDGAGDARERVLRPAAGHGPRNVHDPLTAAGGRS